jgi:hypothetical protein
MTIYEAAGGQQAFLNLAHAWHARCTADPAAYPRSPDDVPHGLAVAKWSWGGPV